MPSRGPAGAEWLGLGVTAPYKAVVAGLVDEVEPEAAAIGAVNNVVRTDDGRLVGFNTDAPGFRAGVELAMGRSLADAEVVVAGAGGAAHAVVCRVPPGRRAARDDREPDGGVGGGPRRPRCRRRPGTVVALELEDPGFGDGARVRRSRGQRDDGRHDRPGHDDRGRSPARRTRPCSTSSTSRPRRRCCGRPARAACARRTARRCSSPQAAIAFERWTGVGGMADVMRAAVAPLLADPTVRA